MKLKIPELASRLLYDLEKINTTKKPCTWNYRREQQTLHSSIEITALVWSYFKKFSGKQQVKINFVKNQS